MSSGSDNVSHWLYLGWVSYRKNLQRAIIAAIVVFSCGHVIRVLRYVPHGVWVHRLTWAYVLAPGLLTGYAFYCLKLARGQSPRARDFLAGFVHFGKVWLTCLIFDTIVCVGLVLFIIPGVLWGLRFSMSMLAVLDKELSPLAALRFSEKITRGHRSKLFTLYVLILALLVFQVPLHYYTAGLTSVRLDAGTLVSCIPYLVSVLVIAPWTCIVGGATYDSLCRRYEESG